MSTVQEPSHPHPMKPGLSYDDRSESYIQNDLSINPVGMQPNLQQNDDEVIDAIERRLQILDKIR